MSETNIRNFINKQNFDGFISDLLDFSSKMKQKNNKKADIERLITCNDCIYAGAMSQTSYSKTCRHTNNKDEYGNYYFTNDRNYSCELGEVEYV